MRCRIMPWCLSFANCYPVLGTSNFKHINRSANGVVDGLASLTRGAPIVAWIFREPPTEVATALLKDLPDLT
ncbi:hypothetical protein V6N12_010206 [Hibiscus sabdariffa]|uniref:RNase H type-1 domain-containing protein n=1 Tax=Hibiscus sabdariffa TaxID=183260 RepID=A0ABR2ATQ9_9ROSI